MSLIYFYKAAGAVLIVFAGLYISSEYSRSVRGTVFAAKDAERLVRYIGECIMYRGDAIGDIIGSYISECTITHALWSAAAETSLADALACTTVPFDDVTNRILSEFASQLGRGYREPQAELCRRTADRLAEHIGSLEASGTDRLRVGSAVCVFVCLSLIILLI